MTEFSDQGHTLWSAMRGAGDAFVLLHPGGADSRALEPLIAELENSYEIHTPEQRAHGHTPDVDGPLTFAVMAADTIAFLQTRVSTPAHLLGYSDGAIVALHIALARPDLVRSLVFAAGVFHVDGWLPGVLDGEAPEFMGNAYGEVSPDGRAHWPVVVQKMATMHAASPALTIADLATVTVPVLVILGDDDEVQLEHAVAMYRAIPNAELAVIPRASHGVLVEKPVLIAQLIRGFHDPHKTNGFAPIGRPPL